MNPPLDSRQLRAFASLARTGSFTLAAKELYLSQSAVSHSMKALEQDVGCRLLDRLGKKVLLTQAGEQLLHHAQKILSEMSQARESLRQLGKWGRARLRVGASTTACQYILIAVLRDNRIDLALALQPKNEEKMAFVPLFTDELVFLMSPVHPWAAAGRVTREEIPRQYYVLYNKNSYTFRMVEEYFHADDMVLNTVIEFGSMEAIKELVKLGLGVSILAPWITQKELQEKSLVSLSLGRRKLKRTWGIMHWRGRRLSLAEETFVSLCRTFTEELAQKSADRHAA